MFLIRLLGGATIEDESGPLAGRAAQRRRIALLAIIALTHPRPVTRDKVIALLWPEHDTERGRHLLRDSLYVLRNTLGEDTLLANGDELRLNPGCVRCDVWEFEAALRDGRPEAAVHAYAGALLDGFHVSDAAELERWLDGARARLAGSYAKALDQLAENAAGQGDAEGVVEWLRRLSAHDPYNSRVAVRLMEALDAAGDRAGAIRHARVHSALLEDEFEAKPDAEVVALAERLREEPTNRSRPVAARAEPQSNGSPAKAAQPGAANTLPGAGSGADRESDVVFAETAVEVQGAPLAPSDRSFGTWSRLRFAVALLTGLSAVIIGGRLIAGSNLREVAGSTAAGLDEPNPTAIAVLPFSNLSRNAGEDFFSDGLTEELIGVLSRLSAFRVVARTSAFAFKGENRDIREIGRALDVGAVLEGSVRREGDRLRVTAQLINVEDGLDLWSETYDRELTDVFAIQNDLAMRIARALEAEVTPAERERLGERPTTNPDAYTFYLKGRYFWNQGTQAGYAQAAEYFRLAIEADSQFAAAYAGLGHAYSNMGSSGTLGPADARELTRQAALRALELDDQLAEAHTIMGGYWHAHGWDSEAAEREHLRAIRLDPNDATARHWYGDFLSSVGRIEDAIEQYAKAVELDPLSPVTRTRLAHTLLRDRRFGAALEQGRAALELDSTYWGGHAILAHVHVRAGRLEEAVRSVERAVELGGRTIQLRTALAWTQAAAGREEEALRIRTELEAEAARTGIREPSVATVFLALGDPEAALAWLDQAYGDRHPGLRFIRQDPRYDQLMTDPRFVDLLDRVGLTR